MAKSQEQEKLTGFKKFQALTQTKSYKTFMAYIYGWGASIVMIVACVSASHHTLYPSSCYQHDILSLYG